MSSPSVNNAEVEKPPHPSFWHEPVEDSAPFGQPFERADLVSAHEAAIAFNICCEDRDKASADFRRVCHACPNANLWRPVWAGWRASST
jgi:hypothetical protein